MLARVSKGPVEGLFDLFGLERSLWSDLGDKRQVGTLETLFF